MQKPSGIILGLDIGTNSIGWAIVGQNEGKPGGIVKAGVRIFAQGVEGDIASGRDEPKNAQRRAARMRRRQLERRKRRMVKLARRLQAAGLLPEGEVGTPEARMALFHELDARLLREIPGLDPHRFLYQLRSKALDEPLPPHAVGRAIYHLAQRRGFLSNRKDGGGEKAAAKRKEQDERSEVKREIQEHLAKMKAIGARTIGEYLSRIDPLAERIRDRWLGRKMLGEEFERICDAQSRRHPALGQGENRKEIHKALFHQRPLKVQKFLIGKCELEPKRTRAPMALLICQRFRLVQKVNDLRLIDKDGAERPLTDDERSRALAALDGCKGMTAGKLRKALGLNGKFNFEKFDDKSDRDLPGNRTAARIREAMGGKWDLLTSAQREQAVEDLRSFNNDEALARRGMKAYGLTVEEAAAFAETGLEDAHASLSRKAIEKLLPLMERGISFATAKKRLYGEKPVPPPAESLPPLTKAVTVRNPVVTRTLTELRKVMNALVREYGKPEEIRVELARDLKIPRDVRKELDKENRDREKLRKRAAEELLRESGIQNPSRRDIEKWLLREECGGICPYTGRSISMDDLFGPTPRFHIEHIIPFSRSLDDSFSNKTLCHDEENKRKGNRTPWEAYGSDDEGYAQVLGRLKKFQGKFSRRKLERFELKDISGLLSDFERRQLNDTRYASRLAVEYLAVLYGANGMGVVPGMDGQPGRKVIQTGKGQVTAYLRDVWEMNGILNDGDKFKTRDDHRHHAVDAVAIALSSPSAVKSLSNAAERAVMEQRRRFGEVLPPWEGFLDQLREKIGEVVVSHRPEHRLSAGLHNETFYSPRSNDPKRPGKTTTAVRKRLDGMSKGQIEEIIDPVIRRTVQESLALAGGDPKKAFAKADGMPRWGSTNGGIPVRASRVRVSDSTVRLGEGVRAREVQPAGNHHVEIFSTTDKKGYEKWDGRIVSNLEAYRRRREGKRVVSDTPEAGMKFVCSLMKGDIIQKGSKEGERTLYIVRKFSLNEKGYPYIEFARIADARKNDSKNFSAGGEDGWRCVTWDGLRTANMKKMAIAVTGECVDAND